MEDKAKKIQENSVGIVETKYYNFPGKMTLESGAELGPIQIAYETYGELNRDKSNVILLSNIFDSSPHAAGFHSESDKKAGWWDGMVGPGKALDTNSYFVICVDFLGSASGTTGPSSVNEQTGKPYGVTFPKFTILDMVNVQKMLIDHLEIKKIHTVIGMSLGGMLVLEWAIKFSEMVENVVMIASSARLNSQTLAFLSTAQYSIVSDSAWNGGDYYQERPLMKGLSTAWMILHAIFSGEEKWDKKFGRKIQESSEVQYNFDTNFQIESYLKYQTEKMAKVYDANTFLYFVTAMQEFDVSSKYSSLQKAFEKSDSNFYIFSFDTDWSFTSTESKEVVKALQELGKNVFYKEIRTIYGHWACVLGPESLTDDLKKTVFGQFKALPKTA